MDRETFGKINIIFYKDRCNKCRSIVYKIERINQKLTIPLRFKMVNCTYYEKYGIMTDSLINLYSKYFDSYPGIFIGVYKVPQFESAIETETHIITFLEHNFIIKEYNKHRFNKDCEFGNGGKVICN